MPPDYDININDSVFDFDFMVKQFFTQKRFGKISSGMNPYILTKNYTKGSYKSTCAYDRTMTHKHMIESKMPS